MVISPVMSSIFSPMGLQVGFRVKSRKHVRGAWAWTQTDVSSRRPPNDALAQSNGQGLGGSSEEAHGHAGMSEFWSGSPS